MSVWVEIEVELTNVTSKKVTLHVSVWVEIYAIGKINLYQRGHAPRERVSWNLQFLEILFRQRVTLHVSVWVEIARRLPVVEEQIVTLHVSVWVEILNTFSEPVDTGVTLHVSVWVEIKLLWN